MTFQTAHIQHGRSSRVPWTTALAVLLILCLTGAPASAESGKFHLNIGFSSRAFVNAPQEDIKVAVGILTRKVARNTVGTADSKIYESTAELEQDLLARKIDAAALVPDDYLKMVPRLRLEPLAVTATEQGHEVELLLLARRDSAVRTIRDLRNRTVAVPARASQYSSMYFTWLDILAMRQGLSGSRAFVARMMETRKPSQALLQVFFRHADACVTTRQTFDVTKELNPQLGRELFVVASLPRLAGGIIVVRQDYPEDRKEKLRRELLALHEDNEGKQLFLLFQLKRLLPYHPEYLQASEAFYAEHRRLARRFKGTM